MLDAGQCFLHRSTKHKGTSTPQSRSFIGGLDSDRFRIPAFRSGNIPPRLQQPSGQNQPTDIVRATKKMCFQQYLRRIQIAFVQTPCRFNQQWRKDVSPT